MNVKPPLKGEKDEFSTADKHYKNTFGCIGMYQQKNFVPKIFRYVLILYYGEEHRKQLMLRKS